MLLLALSLFALAVGPALAQFSRNRPRLLESIDGFVVGALLPICSCGVLSFYGDVSCTDRNPRSQALALLVSAPEMELAAVLLSATLIDPWFALVRPLALSIVGVTAGVLLGSASSPGTPWTPRRPDPRAAFRDGVRFALGETVARIVWESRRAEPLLDLRLFRSVPSSSSRGEASTPP